MKTVHLTLLFILATCSLGCSRLTDIANTNTQSFSYSFTENGCQTGSRVFSSREQMCDGLRNDSQNNFCASNQRYAKFQAECADRSW